MGAILFVCSCTVVEPKIEDYSDGEKPSLVFETNPEPVKGKMDVYDSMARAVKYNVDVVGRSLHKRVSEAKESDPQKIMDKIANANVKDENLLYKALRMLDFALVYANANMGGSQKYADNYFYESAAKYLALEAIRAHQSVWFANKKEKNINALIRQEQKIADNLDKKELQRGFLSDEEYDFNKNQKVLLLRLLDIRNAMNSEWEGFIDLVKLDPPQVELEGRRFYALENFDEDYSLELFQEAAVRNRREFSLAKEFGQFLPYSQVRRYISNSYPPVARLDVNGVKVEYDIYKQELYDKAASIALELITLVNEYKNSKAPIKGGLLKRLFDEFGAAILTQVEVSYQLVMLADFDYENIITAEKKHKKELQRLKKLRHLTDEDRLALFKAKITELQLEQRKSQILSERAEALRGLYFNAGLSPVKVNLTKIPIKDVAADIRKTLNQDLVDMLSGVKVQLKKEKLVDGKSGWAKSSGWLENVVSNATKPVKVTKIEKIIDANKTEKKQEIVVKTQIMQLGAYKELKNANEDWEDLISKFPELKNYNKKLQEVNIDGNKWLRLQVSGNEHEIKNSCDKIKKQGYGCLLR